MTPRPKKHSGKPAFDLIEEATHLLRNAPAGVLLSYYLGAIPAMLGLLYFFADMSRGAFAREHLIEASLLMAGLYIWMKCWQTVFASGLRAALSLEPPAPWTPGRIARLIFTQAVVQPSGLFVRPLAAQVIVPYVWVYGFYQSVGVLGDGTPGTLREVLGRAARQAGLWQRQAHAALLLLFLFALLVALNIAVLLIFVPQLLKMFLNIETVFSRSPMAILNTTVFAAIAALTYLAFDPLRKALYVVRCFHGAALQSGDDLRLDLKKVRTSAASSSSKAAVLVSLLLLFGPVRAAEPLPAAAPVAARVDARELDNSIERVLQRREYAWRMPREKAAKAEKSWISSFVEETFRQVARMFKKAWNFTEKIRSKIKQWFGGGESRGGSHDFGSGLGGAAKPLLYAASALVLVGLGVLGWRMRGMRRPIHAAAMAAEAVPDLRSEDVAADQLPEEGWLKLARDLMAAGELRLALRASYLAGLAHLGHRQLLTIARHKSNRDYERELRRRARQNQPLLGAFDENLTAFERAWYGLHEVTPETLGGFNANLEKIRAC